MNFLSILKVSVLAFGVLNTKNITIGYFNFLYYMKFEIKGYLL